jgi:hypothetical protein
MIRRCRFHVAERRRTLTRTLVLAGSRRPCTIAFILRPSNLGRSRWRPNATPPTTGVSSTRRGEQAAQACGRSRRPCRRSSLPATAPNLQWRWTANRSQPVRRHTFPGVILTPRGSISRSTAACAGGGTVHVLYLTGRTVMGCTTFSARYAAATAECGGRCPIEAGVLGRLADHECRHGRLAFDRRPACGCWIEEGAAVIALQASRSASASSREAA